jgi:quercetin dioxygenase-like cupin family protein
MMYYHTTDNRPTIDISPGVHARSFWGDNLMLVIVDLEPNSSVPTHSHPHEQAGIVLKGEIEFTIADETKMLHPGDIYMIPGGIEHKVIVGAEPVQVLDVFTPVREELTY